MKQTITFLIFVLLVACAPVTANQTSEVSPAGTMSETPKVLPSSTPAPPTDTPTPRPVESAQGQLLLSLGYTDAQLKEFTNFSEGTYQFKNDKGELDTVTYNGIVGTKADGTKELLTLKFNNVPLEFKISSSELVDLGNQARWKINGCFASAYVGNQGDFNNSVMLTDVVSSGLIGQFERQVGDKQIIFKVGLVVTQTDQGFSRPFLTILQMMDKSNPNSDLFKNNFLWSSGTETSLSEEVHTNEEWSSFIPKGKKMELVVRYKTKIYEKIEGFAIFDQFADQDYINSLKNFLDSHGTNQDDRTSIIFAESINFK